MLKTILPFLFLIASGVLLSITVFSDHGLPALQNLDSQKKDLLKKAQHIDKQLAEKRGRIRSLKEDPLALEQKAREDLGMIKEDERVYVFPE